MRKWLLLGSLLFASPVFATVPSIIQCKQGTAPFNSAGTHTITFNSTPVANHHWVALASGIGFSTASQKVDSVADNKGNSSTTHLSESYGAAPTPNVFVGSAKITTTSATFILDFTMHDANDVYGQFWGCEVANGDPTTFFDSIVSTGTGQYCGGCTPTLTASGSSTVNNSIYFGTLSTNNAITAWNSPSGYTTISDDPYEYLRYKVVATIETPSIIVSTGAGASAGEYDGFLAVFRGVDTAPAVTTVTRRSFGLNRSGSRQVR